MEYRTREEIQQYLKSLSLELGVPITDPSYAAALDSRDPLAHFRQKFSIPSIEELMEGKQIAEGTCLLLGQEWLGPDFVGGMIFRECMHVLQYCYLTCLVVKCYWVVHYTEPTFIISRFSTIIIIVILIIASNKRFGINCRIYSNYSKLFLLIYIFNLP